MNEKARLQQIERRIDRIKQDLAAVGDMRPGSLTRQYKDPANKRGPFYQLSYTRDKKSRTEYVSRDRVVDLRREISAYKRFKALTTAWISLSIERSRLRMKLASMI